MGCWGGGRGGDRQYSFINLGIFSLHLKLPKFGNYAFGHPLPYFFAILHGDINIHTQSRQTSLRTMVNRLGRS